MDSRKTLLALGLLAVIALAGWFFLSPPPTPPVAPDAPLVNTYWKLMNIAGRDINTPENQPEAHLVLETGPARRMHGSSGCNNLNGAYTLDGQKLTFGQTVLTRRACFNESAAATEIAFSRILQETRGWAITGETLTLKNGLGSPLARLERRLMR